ncbi:MULTISPECIES: SMP-30/gluconolactonase/LRE family protein [unclassified Gordonia (in: high G+C Gram-positive bacteria)]|uniref:SMP-30/gluconolactonase/LRE family protein n=1 Tax=unclassified Gordonia (in: high G+C Gram-positive bacteria) TaxID=2657482 RepID=UPI001FFF7286|nr:SMP-30/gluconolactonase/LRE family protein [Gordonia sp. PP30]UQE76486.1 SMP-30/gluconolactonase/LRE family protein [Gordonia sp. PP30]
MSEFRRIALPGNGPEDVVCLPDGRVVAGLDDGRLVSVDPATDAVEVLADTAGHLLGLEALADGSLVLCDHDRGILRLAGGRGRPEVLVDTVDGRPLHFASNVVAARDGTLYFTASSQRFTIDHWRSDIIEHSGSGRLIRRTPDGVVEVLRDDFQFANGLVLAPDESYVLVAETGASRITKLWLTGDTVGEIEVLIDGLPGYPDNMSIGSDGLIWCALASPRNPMLEGIFKLPLRARRVLARVPERLGPSPEDVVWVIAFDFDGTLVHDIRPDGIDYTFVTSVAERDGVLYFGTIVDNALGVLTLD